VRDQSAPRLADCFQLASAAISNICSDFPRAKGISPARGNRRRPPIPCRAAAMGSPVFFPLPEAPQQCPRGGSHSEVLSFSGGSRGRGTAGRLPGAIPSPRRPAVLPS
jgi:hypothetical protein